MIVLYFYTVIKGCVFQDQDALIIFAYLDMLFFNENIALFFFLH